MLKQSPKIYYASAMMFIFNQLNSRVPSTVLTQWDNLLKIYSVSRHRGRPILLKTMKIWIMYINFHYLSIITSPSQKSVNMHTSLILYTMEHVRWKWMFILPLLMSLCSYCLKVILISVTWQCDRDRENADDYKQNSLPSQNWTANYICTSS